MKDHEGCKRGFYHLAESWYAKSLLGAQSKIIDQVMVGFYATDGGTTGEFVIGWEMLNGKAVPSLKAYDDSWSVLYHFKDLLEKMEELDDENICPEDFCKILVSLGIEDITKRESPYKWDGGE